MCRLRDKKVVAFTILSCLLILQLQLGCGSNASNSYSDELDPTSIVWVDPSVLNNEITSEIASVVIDNSSTSTANVTLTTSPQSSRGNKSYWVVVKIYGEWKAVNFAVLADDQRPAELDFNDLGEKLCHRCGYKPMSREYVGFMVSDSELGERTSIKLTLWP